MSNTLQATNAETLTEVLNDSIMKLIEFKPQTLKENDVAIHGLLEDQKSVREQEDGLKEFKKALEQLKTTIPAYYSGAVSEEQKKVLDFVNKFSILTNNITDGKSSSEEEKIDALTATIKAADKCSFLWEKEVPTIVRVLGGLIGFIIGIPVGIIGGVLLGLYAMAKQPTFLISSMDPVSLKFFLIALGLFGGIFGGIVGAVELPSRLSSYSCLQRFFKPSLCSNTNNIQKDILLCTSFIQNKLFTSKVDRPLISPPDQPSPSAPPASLVLNVGRVC